ncbi:alginate O-acetyltransferase AlgX-related protein [Phenylobacterium ferrooxidans]|uniref:AlgX/AlgJ SGNH hydrolase-like domain-containing protein n=1 Tax=Phenylobacterium ferrooxidans TaxID=2982689 RepID=A0ABW6CII7_9CAUL
MTTVERLRLADIQRIDAEHDAAAGPGHPASALKLGALSPGGTAVAGSDGHLFIRDGGNRWEQQYLGEITIVEAWRKNWRYILGTRQQGARDRGLELWNVIVPDKQVLLSDKRWPPNGDAGGKRPIRFLQEGLPAMARLLYPEAELRAGASAAPMYFRHNSHWTASGCCAAAEVVLAAIAPMIRLGDMELAGRCVRASQDLTDHFFDPAPEEDLLKLLPVGEVVFDNRHLELTGKHIGNIYVVENPQAPDPRRLILFGDSCAYEYGLAAVLSAVFARVAFVWSNAVDWDMVAEHRADLVLCESVERYIATLPKA